jgi:hypothetical protein
LRNAVIDLDASEQRVESGAETRVPAEVHEDADAVALEASDARVRAFECNVVMHDCHIAEFECDIAATVTELGRSHADVVASDVRVVRSHGSPDRPETWVSWIGGRVVRSHVDIVAVAARLRDSEIENSEALVTTCPGQNAAYAGWSRHSDQETETLR